MSHFLTIRWHGKTVAAICFMLFKPWDASATNWEWSILSINTKNTHLWCNSLTHHNILKCNHCIMLHSARFLNVALGGNNLWPQPHHIRDSALWSQWHEWVIIKCSLPQPKRCTQWNLDRRAYQCRNGAQIQHACTNLCKLWPFKASPLCYREVFLCVRVPAFARVFILLFLAKLQGLLYHRQLTRIQV